MKDQEKNISSDEIIWFTNNRNIGECCSAKNTNTCFLDDDSSKHLLTTNYMKNTIINVSPKYQISHGICFLLLL